MNTMQYTSTGNGVLITGANGFLGKNLIREFFLSEKRVIAVCNSLDDEFKNNQKMLWINPEGRNPIDLQHDIKNENISCIYHLAWGGTSGNKRGDYETQIDNIKLACDYVRLCETIGCKRFIYASSINEVETYEYLKSDGISPGGGYIYGSAKLAAHLMAEVVAYQSKIDFIPCLITNVYGAGEKSARLINDSVRKLIRGEHCSFSAGNQTYDFIYITDAINAIIAVSEKGKPFTQYYIGSGNPKPLKEFLWEMKEVVSPYAVLGLGELPFNGKDIDYRQFNLDGVLRDTGYKNQISFKQGIQLVLDSIKNEE
ncbi:NAD(P)-dependent oxidoreductase [Treponema parvum]|uniref:NAD(P)-dependent oxidoreductase n=1 Tax=Treponema parvum TaxID=138851 RepID=A0A975EYM3_9SPIR|nr:NAD(P)-dependent oxidoreductase [Treponema parvum]QTQ11299.1 NAD(P)-dependent oxidoreductase [Treponema parvum]QTQ16761.1 NAD(P)-dependent oxidoreductase [Treponema parvum]